MHHKIGSLSISFSLAQNVETDASLIVSVEHTQCFVAVHRLSGVAVPPDAGVVRAVVDMVAAVLAEDVGVHLGILVAVVLKE